ncbi:YopX family protein [Lactiplantibacillus plantarum]
MMIKFRAWSKDLSKYRKLDDISNDQGLGMFFEVQNGIGSNATSICYSINDIPEQFTGLKDVNGKDVYEGDIVQPVRPDTKSKIGTPFKTQKGNYVYGKWAARSIADNGYGVIDWYTGDELVVIGNVHENPELLGEDK